MNEQLPPIDSCIREQLLRRSAVRAPDGLIADISAALDRADSPAAVRVRPRLTWVVPRLAGTVAVVAGVALIGAALVIPALRSGPVGAHSGYPADRALTTTELAALLSGPPLPANAALVAEGTIDVRYDVCPMNRMPTLGTLEGMGGQVCVMNPAVTYQLYPSRMTGTFAFRYLGAGYLIFMGQVKPAGSRLAYAVTDEWPQEGQTFVVEGYLGGWNSGCTSTPVPGMPEYLLTVPDDPCSVNWLSSDGTAPVGGDAAWGNTDRLTLRGNARYVEADGARQLDGLAKTTSGIHGFYVVRSATGPCPGASPIDSRGCVAWRVLARVSDVTAEPAQSVAPTETARPSQAPESPAPTT